MLNEIDSDQPNSEISEIASDYLRVDRPRYTWRFAGMAMCVFFAALFLLALRNEFERDETYYFFHREG